MTYWVTSRSIGVLGGGGGRRYSLRALEGSKIVDTLIRAQTAQDIVDYVCSRLPIGTPVEWFIT